MKIPKIITLDLRQFSHNNVCDAIYTSIEKLLGDSKVFLDTNLEKDFLSFYNSLCLTTALIKGALDRQQYGENVISEETFQIMMEFMIVPYSIMRNMFDSKDEYLMNLLKKSEVNLDG